MSNAGPNDLADAGVHIRIDKRRDTVSLATPEGWACNLEDARDFQANCRLTAPLLNGAVDTFVLGIVTGGKAQPPFFTIRGSVAPQAFDPNFENDEAAKRVQVVGTTSP